MRNESVSVIRVRDTRTGYLLPVRDALWGPARMDVLFPRRRRRRRRRHSEKVQVDILAKVL